VKLYFQTIIKCQIEEKMMSLDS